MFTTRQYVYIDGLPLTTSDVKRMPTEFYSKLMRLNLGPFRVIKVSPSKLAINEYGFPNTVSVNRPTVAPSMRNTQPDDDYVPNQLKDERNDNITPGEGQTLTDQTTDARREFAFD